MKRPKSNSELRTPSNICLIGTWCLTLSVLWLVLGLAKSRNSGRRHCTVASGSGPRGARWTDAYHGAGTQMMQRKDAFETRARVVYVVSFVDEDVCDAFLKGFSKSTDFTVRWLASAFSFLIGLLEPAVWASGFCWDTAASRNQQRPKGLLTCFPTVSLGCPRRTSASCGNTGSIRCHSVPPYPCCPSRPCATPNGVAVVRVSILSAEGSERSDSEPCRNAFPAIPLSAFAKVSVICHRQRIGEMNNVFVAQPCSSRLGTAREA